MRRTTFEDTYPATLSAIKSSPIDHRGPILYHKTRERMNMQATGIRFVTKHRIIMTVKVAEITRWYISRENLKYIQAKILNNGLATCF